MNKPKKLISVTVDHDLWFYHRNKDTNISQLVNEVLRVHRDSEKVTNKEVTELEKELEDLKEQSKLIEEKKTATTMLLINKKIELEKNHEDEMELVEQMNTVLDAGGQFKDMI